MTRVLLITSLLLVTGCPGFGDQLPIGVENPTYNVDVKPILDTKCVICHQVPPVLGAPATLRLDQYADDGAIQGAFSQAERIRVRSVQGFPSFMPPAPALPLSGEEQATIDNWVTNGAPEN